MFLFRAVLDADLMSAMEIQTLRRTLLISPVWASRCALPAAASGDLFAATGSKEEANTSSCRARPDQHANAALAEASDLETLVMRGLLHQHDGLRMPEEPGI